MHRRSVYGVLAFAVILTIIGLVPPVRHVIWSGILWGIFAIAMLLVLGVAGNIVWAMWTMYSGYGVPDMKAQPLRAGPDPSATVLPFTPSNTEAEIVAHAGSEDVLLELCRAECALSNLETSFGFQTLTAEQKNRYFRALAELHSLVRDVSATSTHEKVAS